MGETIPDCGQRAELAVPIIPTEEAAKKIVEHLFPTRKEDAREILIETESPPPFTAAEIRKAGVKLKKKKAPGLDELPPEAIRLITQRSPE